MFIDFFYTLKDVGVPVSPTSFLTLHKALRTGLINTLNDFYTSSRAILVKSTISKGLNCRIMQGLSSTRLPGH
jgi:uncharacterized protein with von Willebrand factor type A (vWA) domain